MEELEVESVTIYNPLATGKIHRIQAGRVYTEIPEKTSKSELIQILLRFVKDIERFND